MTNIETVKQFVGKRRYADHPQYRDAMTNMRFDTFLNDDVLFLMDLYSQSKDIFSRNQILQAFDCNSRLFCICYRK